jgi:hypothetical protein
MSSAKPSVDARRGQGVKQLAEAPNKHLPAIGNMFIFPIAGLQEKSILTKPEDAFIVDSQFMFLANSAQHRFCMRLT